MRIAFATSNPGKLREASAILAGVELVGLKCWLDSEEVNDTYFGNAVAKAAAAARYTLLPVLAEDSGLEVDALGGRPGVRSARWAGNDAQNNARLVRELSARGLTESGARYRAVAVVVTPGGKVVRADGVFEGTVRVSATGSGGFGYDPHFVPAGHGISAAEMTPEQKNHLSHRGQALKALAAELGVL